MTTLTPRDWQFIAQQKALELAGTPEAAEKLAESKRYGALADELDRLRSEVETLRDDAMRLEWVFNQGDEYSQGVLIDQPGDGDYYVHGVSVCGQGKTMREAIDAARNKWG